MIGLALVTLVATLAAGITQTFRGAVNDIFTSDYAITAQNNYSPIPVSIGETAAQAPGVTAVGSVRTGETKVFGETTYSTAVTPQTKDVVTLVWKDGSQDVFTTLGENGAFVDDGYADDHHLTVGSNVPGHVRHRQDADVHREGDLRSADRRLAVRLGDDLGCHVGRRESAAEGPVHVPQGRRAASRTPTRPRSRRRSPGTRTPRCRPASSSSTTRSRASTRS